MAKTRVKLIGALAILLVGLASCDNDVVYEENREIAKAVWSADEPVVFSFEVQDTVSMNNMFINLRNGDNYPFSNLFLFVEMSFPNGKTKTDTIECFLAAPNGEWLGSGIGNVYDNRFLYQKQKRFPLEGQYKVKINQAMRRDSLPEIYDVGFRIARAK
ncbi:gliding motility lipoprotein GldH [Halocola ammonii]